MSLDDEVRAAAGTVLGRGGELGTTPLAKAVLAEMGEDESKEAVDSVCKALQRWAKDGGPAVHGSQKTRFGAPMLMWSSGNGGATRAAPRSAPGGRDLERVIAALERIADALEGKAPAAAAKPSATLEAVLARRMAEAEVEPEGYSELL